MKLHSHLDYVLLIIFSVAAGLRLYQPEYAPYWADMSSTLSSATRLAHDGEMVWLGNPSAWGGLTAHSPFSVYFTAIPLIFFKQPVVAYIWFNILGILTVLLTYYGVKQYFGVIAARISALALAVSPLAIYWSEFVWNPNIAPFIIVGWWWTALLGYNDNKNWSQILHWILLGFLIQSQAALAVLIPASSLLLIWAITRSAKKQQMILNFLIGVVTSVILAVPWIYGIYGESQGWWGVPFGVGNSKSAEVSFSIPNLRQVFEQFIYLTSGFYHWAGSRAMLLEPNRASWSVPEKINIVLGLQGIITLLGLGGFLYKARQQWGKDRFVLYAFTALVTLVPFSYFFLSVRISDFYLQPVTYSGVIIFGVIMAFLWQHQRVMTLAIIVLIFSTQLWLAVSRHDWFIHGENRSATTLAEIENQLRSWQNLTGDIVFVADGGDISAFTVTEWKLNMSVFDEQFPIRSISQTNAIPIAQNGSTLVSFVEGTVLPTYYGTGQTVDIGGGGKFRYLAVTPNDLPTPDFLPIGDSTYDDLMHVEGIIVSKVFDETLPIMIRWQPLQETVQQYQFSIRLVDTDGNRMAQVDGSTLEPGVWRLSDTVITRLTMSLPEDIPESTDWQFELLVYSFPEIENVTLKDGSGTILHLSPR